MLKKVLTCLLQGCSDRGLDESATAFRADVVETRNTSFQCFKCTFLKAAKGLLLPSWSDITAETRVWTVDCLGELNLESNILLYLQLPSELESQSEDIVLTDL